VIFPLADKPVKVPTLVIFGCAAVATVPYRLVAVKLVVAILETPEIFPLEIVATPSLTVLIPFIVLACKE
jgi:hypothetical protein